MLVPNPRMIEELVREIPSGAVSTPRLMRKILAARYGAETTCPLCTGIFLRLIAEAANEAREAGHSDVLPYWRVVDSKGKPNPKFPGGVEGQMMLQESELVDCTRSSAWIEHQLAELRVGGSSPLERAIFYLAAANAMSVTMPVPAIARTMPIVRDFFR